MTQQPDIPRKTEVHSQSASVLPAILVTGTFAFAGLALALVAWSRNYVIHDIPLTAALNGDLVHFQGRRTGGLAYYAAGPVRRGVPPLVLVHSVNAAASSYEMKPLFEHYARTRRVIALDLPGYGFSERSDREYTPALMRDAIFDLVEQELDGQTVDIVGLSLSSEYVAMAAQSRPLLFRKLAFITPTGFSTRDTMLTGNDTALRWLRVPAWSRPIFDLLTSRPSIGYFLSTNQKSPVKRATINYAYATSHQPNAEIAPYYFLTFKLWDPAIFHVYRQLTQPCLLIHGKDPFARYDMAAELPKANWRIVDVPGAGSLAHWDKPREVIDLISKHIG